MSDSKVKLMALSESLMKAPKLSETQQNTFDKNIALFTEDTTTQSIATRSRHKSAKLILEVVLEQLGADVFFLCAIGLTMTVLSKQTTSEFVEELEPLQSQLKTSSVLHDLRQKYEDILSKYTIGQKAADRSRVDTAPAEQRPVKRHRAEEVEVEDTASEASEDVFEFAKEGLEESLEGKVYALEAMDAIRMLSNSKIAASSLTLTMPFSKKVLPFVIFKLPRQMALKNLTEREQIM
ncbi:hypothetical protein NKR23_g10451 [Pleurostoma richardsiae]|uniref:Uncharacterized protein n=1 Tax=Pleurostoma richardsiae TaxID=41990 RepID=A0AA38VBW1_9PEZI|nr:hypothetical protein NKR23_g10451 [Pleurostoma richardsiae]